jgi:hypothetical protein
LTYVRLQIILWLRNAKRRLVAKHDAFMEKAKQEKTKLAEAHTAEHAKLCGDLDLETRNYMEYHQTMHRRLRVVFALPRQRCEGRRDDRLGC